ncbi:MAG: L-serine ammonia-lyase, partial [Chitinophagales bacterium]|nr:L-serine ammonia-lyase [Chitinophagales bacterium]
MESISAFEIIKIGIGPSSSHTMGPWEAATLFIEELSTHFPIENTINVNVYLYGSLAKTGKGHGTDVAVMMSLSGEDYKKIDTNTIDEKVDRIKKEKSILFSGVKKIQFDYDTDIIFEYHINLPFHPNGIKFVAESEDEQTFSQTYYSIGGGFVIKEDESQLNVHKAKTPYQCNSGEDILKYCKSLGINMAELVKENEKAWRTEEAIDGHALRIWEEIKDCIYRGAHKEGILPGGLFVKRRAYDLNLKLIGELKYSTKNEWLQCIRNSGTSFSAINKWVSCFALAVNEENASFGRIITAPTNGAAGVIPAVLMYAYCFTENFSNKKIIDFLLVAGEIGTLFKKAATISAAMGGCQAEIGVSSAMAAAALTHTQGGTVGQVLMAAEIAMEHHLGMTCDPVGGLVQIPCIERNSMGAIKAITASNIALESDPANAKVSLDDVIKTMWQTALDMNSKYKETSEGGLA